jgi:hypothetical protein
MTSTAIVNKVWNFCHTLRDDGVGYGVWNFCHTLRDDGVGYGDYLEQLTCCS